MFMRRIPLTLFALTTLISLLSARPALPYEDEDIQYWNQIAFEMKPAERWLVHVHEEFRLYDDASHYDYQQTDAYFAYEVTSFFSAGGGFKYLYVRDDQSNWHSEFRPHINAWLTSHAGPFVITDRNRFEYRVRQAARDEWRYRNRLDIEFPPFYKPVNFRFYAADEIFITIDNGWFNGNRIYGGFRFTLLELVDIDLFYLRYYLKDQPGAKGWQTANVIGTYITFLFK